MPYHYELTMVGEINSHFRLKFTSLLGVLVALSLFALIGDYSVRMAQDYSNYDQDRATQRYATLAKLRQAESKLLHPVDADGKPTAEWVEQAKGTIRIPIEEAITKELDTLQRQAPAIGCEIPGAVPAPAQPTATPAAPATPPASAPAKPKK